MECTFGMFSQVDKDVVDCTVGNNYPDSLLCYFARNVGFGHHSSPAEVAFAALDIFGKVVIVVYRRYNLRAGSLGIAVENAVDVRQNNQRVAVHHGCN